MKKYITLTTVKPTEKSIPIEIETNQFKQQPVNGEYYIINTTIKLHDQAVIKDKNLKTDRIDGLQESYEIDIINKHFLLYLRGLEYERLQIKRKGLENAIKELLKEIDIVYGNTLVK